MAALYPWIDRTFDFNFSAGKYPDIIERLRGTPARVADLLRDTPGDILTLRQNDRGWSIQENIGHLGDTEALFSKRLDEFLAGAEALTAADMTNRSTREAQHNERLLAEVLSIFQAARRDLVQRVEALVLADFERTAHHPRLEQTMRLVDLLVFLADHDDYHLARVTELKRCFMTGGR